MTPKTIMLDGLWKNNPGLVQLIGLCPLLAVSTTVIQALCLGIATLFVLTGSNFFISLLRGFIPHSLRLPLFILIIASLVISASFMMEAFSMTLYQQLGLFFALITTNCAVLARAEAFAASQKLSYAVLDGVMQGLGFALVLLVLGTLREVLGHGSFLQGASQIFGEEYQFLEWHFTQADAPFLLMLLPPGAFLLLGFLVAGYQALRAKPSRPCQTACHQKEQTCPLKK